MKALGHSACVFAVLLFLCGCGNTEAYNRQLKTLDSLDGAIHAAVKELEKTDTVLLQKAVTRFAQYRQFIQQNINDTIAKSDADDLKRFYNSGKNLEAFQSNRAAFIARAHLVNSQLMKLTADIKHKAIDAQQAQLFLDQELPVANSLCETGSLQKNIFYTGIEEFKTALRGVESLIKSRNNGELPVIVKDTLSL